MVSVEQKGAAWIILNTLCSFPIIVILWKILINGVLSAKPSATQCRTIEGDRLKMDCVNVRLTGVPEDFDRGMTYLDLSQNNLVEMTTTSFYSYGELMELYMKKVLPNPLPVPKEIFRPLGKLEILDISLTFFNHPNLLWPPQLKKLVIDGSSFREPDFSDLKNLEEFSGQNCSMEVVPKFNELAPLKIIDLRFNSMNLLDVKQIAPYCLVKKLLIYYGPQQQSLLTTQPKFCKCLQLEKWSAQYLIRGIFPLNCTRRIEQDCELELLEETDVREKCLGIIGSGIPRWILIAAGFLGIVVLFLIISYLYHRFLRKDLATAPTKQPKQVPTPRAAQIIRDDEEVEEEGEEEADAEVEEEQEEEEEEE